MRGMHKWYSVACCFCSGFTGCVYYLLRCAVEAEESQPFAFKPVFLFLGRT